MGSNSVHCSFSTRRSSSSASNPWLDGNNISVFEAVSAAVPDKTAIISRCGIFDYSTLNARANQLAWHLCSMGIGPEKVVAVRLRRGADAIICMLAIWKSGGAYVPVDPSVPEDRAKYVLADSGAVCLITTKSVADSEPLGDLVSKPTIYLDDTETVSRIRQLSLENVHRSISPESLAYIIYTSGTSGTPKGVGITHDSLLNMAEDHRQSGEITSSDRVMVFSPFCFDASMRDINGALLNHATLYMPDEEEVLPGNLIRTLRQQRITYSVITPSALRTCQLEDLPHLRTLVVAGEAVDKNLIKKWGSGRTIINAYGPTEATVCSTKRVYRRGIISSNSPVSIGKPTLNSLIYILDQERSLVKTGGIGEIYIGGPGVSRRGYINLPQMTEKCFSKNPFGPGRLYKSGDMGRFLPDGNIEYLGRIDKQIKLNGQRIEIEEIEACLRSDDTVRDAIVTLRGPENKLFLAAYIIASEVANTWERLRLTDHLKRLLRRHLPSYSVPSTISYMESWPLSMANKILKDSLPDPLEQAATAASHECTLSSTERKVANILRGVLELPCDTVLNARSTYAELGGSSLLVAMLLHRINDEFGSNITVGSFYSSGTSIADLVALTTNDHLQDASLFHEDLQDAVLLPSDIVPLPRSLNSSIPSGRGPAVLTGATGYLGGHILAQLLSTGCDEVACVVRARDASTAYVRIKESLQHWGLWQEQYRHRIRAVPGDVGKPFMGMDPMEYENLARNSSQIWHCAASVNFIAPYRYLEEANVTGTIEVLRLASAFVNKKLFYISTLAAFFGAADQIGCGLETTTRNLGQGIVTGYAQTKWVSEQLVCEFQSRGGHAVIMRPGRLLGSTERGLNPELDLNVCLFRAFIESGTAPDLDWKIDFTPIDICARAALDIASNSEGGIFHLINPQSVTLRHLINLMNNIGYNIKLIPYTQWKEQICFSQHIRPLLSMFQTPVDERGRSVFDVLLDNSCFRESSYGTQNTEEILLDSSQLWKFPAYEDLLALYLRDFTTVFGEDGKDAVADRNLQELSASQGVLPVVN